MEQDELLRFGVEALKRLGLRYLVTGSMATVLYGEPREGGSEKHLRDITGILKISAEQVDRKYITDWADRLGLSEIWLALARRVPP